MSDLATELTAEFSAQRPRLLGVAYRMLGSIGEAEDVVQEVWLRWQRAERLDVVNPAAWLTTATTRAAIDRHRELRRRREDYVGPWLPEPVAVDPQRDDPAAAAELGESLTLGFLVLLEALSPVERAVFLLADVFDVPFREVAVTVEKTETNCRQIATRARRKIRRNHPGGSSPASRPLLVGLLRALGDGDIDSLLHLVAPDVVLLSDGGGHRRAARHPVVGAPRVVTYLRTIARRNGGRSSARRLRVNGTDAYALELPDRLVVLDADATGGKLTRIRLQSNPDKLAGLTTARRLV
jgi:RNA polymerase sigma-70 factor (ECF subfamily)